MSAGPVIIRELREGSRRPLTYWLRVGGGLALAGGVVVHWMIPSEAPSWAGISSQGQSTMVGLRLFGALNTALLLALPILVPLLTADAISRERREGTLGLLFLTPLTARGIVVGKTLVHLLRAQTLFLTVIPWLMVPVLLGGVGWREVVLAVLLHASLLLLGLSAGLLATSQTKDWTRAMLLAEAYSVVLGVAFLSWHRAGLEAVVQIPGFWLGSWLGKTSAITGTSFMTVGSGESRGVLVRLWSLVAFTADSGWSVSWGAGGPPIADTPWGVMFARLGPGATRVWLGWAGLLCGASLVSLLVTMQIAAVQIRKSWQELPPSARQRELQDTFVKPRYWQRRFRGRLARALNRNPIGWLHQYSVGARLVKWGWCLAAIVVETLIVSDDGRSDYLANLRSGQAYLAAVLLVGLAFSAAASFRRERESGALELLLVAPLTPGQIIFGRLRGIWMQFAPALGVVLAAGVLADRLWDQPEGYLAFLSFGIPVLAAGILVSVVGLYLSTFDLNVLAAWLCTCAISLLLGGVVWRGMAWLAAATLEPGQRHVSGSIGAYLVSAELGRSDWASLFVIALRSAVMLGLAALFARRLHQRLARREFVLR